MSDKAIKRQGYPVGPDDWLLKNGTGAAVVKGQIVGVTVAAILDTAEAVSTTNKKTLQAISLEACPNDAAKSFRVRVNGVVDALVPDGTTAGELLMVSSANTNLLAYATDTKAANRSAAVALEANASGSLALKKVLFNGFRFVSVNAVT